MTLWNISGKMLQSSISPLILEKILYCDLLNIKFKKIKNFVKLIQ